MYNIDKIADRYVYAAGVLTKEQTLEALKIKKLYNQLVLSSEKALSHLNFIGILSQEEMRWLKIKTAARTSKLKYGLI